MLDTPLFCLLAKKEATSSHSSQVFYSELLSALDSLRPLDVEFMKALHQRVNIVPVLAKADTLMPSEVERMKCKVKEEIGANVGTLTSMNNVQTHQNALR